ncbi:MAG: NosD domain-containing protein, partial [Candidatus Bathyarchaeia archaeon]
TFNENCGISFGNSLHNRVFKNNLVNNSYGITLGYSQNNIIIGNNISNNSWKGISLDYSSNNTLIENNFMGNRYSFYVLGNNTSHYVNYVDVSNTINGKPVYYLINKKDCAIPLNAGFVGLVNCTNIIVENLDLTSSGMIIAFTLNTTAKNNVITNSLVGIEIYNSSNIRILSNNIEKSRLGVIVNGYYNYVLKNNVTANYFYGIAVGGSYNNISENNVIANGRGISIGGTYNYACANNITKNGEGILLGGTCNYIVGNNITANKDGIYIGSSTSNLIFGNIITKNSDYGVFLGDSSYNTIYGNNITKNTYGIYYGRSSDNKFYHNNLIDNARQIYDRAWDVDVQIPKSTNVWNNWYPSGGNYWSDYKGVDKYNGPYQNISGSDGIGDTPYLIDKNNKDMYPLINPCKILTALSGVYILRVQSHPVTGVEISFSGDYSGNAITNFDMGPNFSPFTATLTAPSIYQGYIFDHWELDGSVFDLSNSVIVEVNEKYSARVATAVYTVSTGASAITLKDYRYEDVPLTTFESIVEELGGGNIAVKGKFYANLVPYDRIREAKLKIIAEYVTTGERGVVKEETRSFNLKPINNEFVADIALETLWPFFALNWFAAFAGYKILGNPEYLIEQIGEDVYLPEYFVYIGFERIYIGAKVVKIVGVDVSGKEFEISLDTPLPLKTSYTKLAEWAKRNDYIFTVSLSPVTLSVSDKSGNRVGAYDGKIVKKISNMYYVGEPGKPQLIVIESPPTDSEFKIEIGCIHNGLFTLIAGQKTGDSISKIVLASGAQIKQGEEKAFTIKSTSNGIIIVKEVPWWIEHEVWIIAGVIVTVAIITVSITTLIKKRKRLVANY